MSRAPIQRPTNVSQNGEVMLAYALGVRLPGLPKAWGGHGGMALAECRTSSLRAFNELIGQQLRDGGDNSLAPLAECITVVVDARDAGEITEPPKRDADA